MECGLPVLRLLVQQRALRAPFPGRAAATRHGRGDGRFDLLPGASSFGRRPQNQRPAGHRHHARGPELPKIHAVCDALGNPLRFVLTPGQRHDSKPVPELLDGLQAKAPLADKAYDSDKIVQAAEKRGMQVIIPSRVNREKQRVLDKHRYKTRHLIENLFQRMKAFRRVATRFDKLDIRSLGFVHIAGIMKWLH
ncbi:IS5 family transposase [Polaromonas naphthalenivorans]|uniref:Transposase, IS4 family n=1 Tax=Polaromonas naphthalenivorans (strain CJ2) TaxID=365044 RepID=A1VJM9_POLNA|nr:transposase, IS4 family [Polaromonas naphthalenivorans CJ2]